MRGALMALSDKLDCHILVIVSTEKRANQLEQFGENAGLDMVFHAECLSRSADFLDRCSSAKCVVLVGIGGGSDSERQFLAKRRISVIVCGDRQVKVEGLPDATILKLGNALEFKTVLERQFNFSA